MPFELFGSGRSWLGPSWTIEGEPGATTPPKPGPRISVSGAEIAEWSYRMGQHEVTQTILLLGGRRLASCRLCSRLAPRSRRSLSVRALVSTVDQGRAAASVPRVSPERPDAA